MKLLKRCFHSVIKITKEALNSSSLFNKILNIQDRLVASISFFSTRNENLSNILLLQGRSLAIENSKRAPFYNLNDAEFKVFSQSGEDGIIQYLIRETEIETKEKIFVEFGVEDYSEANTRFLLMNNFWKGLIIDGSQRNIKKIKKDNLYWKSNLTAIDAWINKDNINGLIKESGFSGKIGLLSIDIDGNDYWVWERINVIDPVIVVIEWNSVFGSQHAVSVPYSPKFDRREAHYSCLYWGASMKAFEILGKQKGYKLVGSNNFGNNIFFVKEERIGRLTPKITEEAYVLSQFRDSRNQNGDLNYLSGDARYKKIHELPLIEVESNSITSLKELNR